MLGSVEEVGLNAGGVGLVRDEEREERDAQDEGQAREEHHAQPLAPIDALAGRVNDPAHASVLSKPHAARYAVLRPSNDRVTTAEQAPREGAAREGLGRDEHLRTAGPCWACPGNDYEAGVANSEERPSPEERSDRTRP